jgi:PTS system nitrogen regulatory IIA component
MKNLLNALQEGRFVELPETNKEQALNYLANLIEAMPDLAPGTDVAGSVLSRETQFNTGIGMGWACPHMRTPHEGDIIWAVGWSPGGIDYHACDQKPVYVVMYYVPDSQKAVYLKEISALVKAIQRKHAEQDFAGLQTLARARNWILDLVSTAVESQMSDAKARMIHLEARQAAAATVPPEAGSATLAVLPHAVVPVSIVITPGAKAVALAQDQDLISKLETAGDIDPATLAKQVPFDHAGYTFLVRGVTNYQYKRMLYDCLAIKLNGAAAAEKLKTGV